MRHPARWALTALVVAISSPALHAQMVEPASPSTGAAASATTPPSAVWEVAAYGGFAGRVHTGGTPVLPPADAPITTSNPTFPSRAISSWWFGDGTLLFNDASGDLGLAGRIAPLDTVLSARSLVGQGAAGGVRLSRQVTARLSVDVTVDVLSGASALASTATGAIETSRASFVSGFTGLFAAGPYSGTAVTATSSTATGSARQIATTGAIRMTFARRVGVVPYVSVGGGLLIGTGSMPSATLTGTYRTVAATVLPISETDLVTVGFAEHAVPIGLVGAGARRAISDHWGLEAVGRLLVGPQPITATLTATPVVAPGTPAGFIESFSYPSIQFSNSSTTGRVSTLSGPTLHGVSASTGGLAIHALASVGLYVRF